MKLRKGILIGLSIALAMILGISSNVNAETDTAYLGVEQYRASGYSYSAHSKTVWKIASYPASEVDTTGSTPSFATTFYCIKAGPGFGSRSMTDGSFTGARKVRTYKRVTSDLKDLNTVSSPYSTVLPTGDNYKALMWVLEHCYIPELDDSSKTDRTTLLANAGIRNSKLTDDDIDTVQQLAIWYFTNNDEAPYNEQTFELYLKRASEAEGTPLSDISDDRADQALDLFDYFRNGWVNAGKPNPVSNNTTNPISSINSSNATIVLDGNDYILGPFSIEQAVNMDYTLTAKLLNGSTEVPFTILNSSKQTSDINSVKNGQFYIKVNTSNYASGLTFSVQATTTEKNISYWSVTAANAAALAYDQPVVQVGKKVTPYPAVTTVTPNIPKEKVFDLALRKFITEVNGTRLVDSNGRALKEPVVDVTPLVNKTGTTAIYKHQKAPVSVAVGDEVIYTIRVYNEGELDGYVTEIKDHLPAQLEYVDDAFNRGKGWSVSQDGRTVTATVNGKLLKAFEDTMTTPDYLDIQIKCKVKNVNLAGLVITNIAQITGFTDSNGNTITDRDSQAGNTAIPSDSNFPSYKGKDTNKNDLTDSNYYYQGQQDDDDFDKLILKPFDLALRKFIVKINGNDVETRQPAITNAEKAKLANSNATFDNGSTLEKDHTKTPLKVANGDVVLYTIRVYNEGQVDGKATVITDHLPEGLTFKTDSTINTENGWTNPSGDGKTIITNKLSDRVLAAFNGTTLDYADVQIECIVTAGASTQKQSLKNVAEITTATDRNGNEVTDIDSVPGDLTNNQIKNYNPETSEKGKGYQDDDDYEELVIPGREFDLALRKFITKVNESPLVDSTGKYIKEPVIDITPLVNYTDTTAIYKHQKAPVGVKVGDEVIYTIRVYNEGEIDGYVTEITDHLPTGLEFINDEFNAQYGWTSSADGRTIKTTITSPNTLSTASRDILYADRTTSEDKVLLKAFDGETLDYIEVQVKCRVKATENLDNVITNIADITAFTDSEGNTVTDRDSQKDNVTLPTTEQEWSDYKGNSGKSILDDSNYYYKGQQDDDDFDKLILQEFDLALRKFITGVNDTAVTNRYPVFTTDKDENGNYIYRHTKEPILVETTDLVEYTIRIYNEGDIAGYASIVKDDIPDGLEFVPVNEINTEYRWIMLDKDGNETTDSSKAEYIVTDYLSRDQQLATGRDNLLNPFNQENMATPDYRDVKAVFKVVAPNSYDGIITNTAEIADDEDENGNPIIDRDSTPDNNNPKEDDIDVEHIKLTYFDLALRKFITGVDDTEVTNRYPVFSIDEDGNYIYTHTKEPVEVENGNIVTYTIRVYNEGTMNGYAKEVKDDLPEGLLFLPDNEINTEYRWVMLDENGEETDDVSKAVSIATDYLSKDQENETDRDNLLLAFDPDTMEEPDHRDIKIAFKVTEPNTSDRILINKAQISNDEDENGNEVIDKDSTPDKWIDKEDDQDIEKVKVKYFDLALRKWVTQAIVIENGKQTVTNTGHKAEDNPEKVVKVEIAKSKVNKVVVKFKYSIRITNEGEIAGYAKEISDYIPTGLKFVQADNPDWKEVDGKIVTTKLENTLLQPGESAEVEVLLTWINGANNMGLKVNVAEISKDYNDSHTPDIDSTPNNKKDGEDDIDDAPVLLATKTGELINTEYILIGVASLAILSTGVVLIKKYIL